MGFGEIGVRSDCLLKDSNCLLESGLVGRSEASEKRLEKALDQVGVAAEGIRAGRFAATPSAMRCGYCPFREICPDAQR